MCPSCGAPEQEPGKYCDICGAQVASSTVPATSGGNTVRFGLVTVDGVVDAGAGFSLTGPSEVLVGRPDPSGSAQPVGVDLRRWAQPYEVDGQKMYLVHRKQCYVVVRDGGSAAIRAYPGAEGDTFVRPAGAGDDAYAPLSALSSVRPPLSDGSFLLEPADRVYMGDPTALEYYRSGNPTARGSYVIFEYMGATP